MSYPRRRVSRQESNKDMDSRFRGNDREYTALHCHRNNSFQAAFPVILLSLAALFPTSCDSSNTSKQQQKEIPKIVPRIIRSIPHDNQAFTQGLLFHKGNIYESTGLQGKSSLRCINAQDGAIQKNIPVPGIFAEGLVLKEDKIIQLTWTSGNAIIYSYPDLKSIGAHRYQGEGWGITTDGKDYIMVCGCRFRQERQARWASLSSVPRSRYSSLGCNGGSGLHRTTRINSERSNRPTCLEHNSAMVSRSNASSGSCGVALT